ncbi:hypothetical protein [Candidatus Marinarcus aquaticus]|uniref:DUF3649 domain-containing protein n=1 Tax=Candidatus Marinarcus aquaticus TaxID=2044504 RepID=A0A4Q0XR75_9BACT|nr:hypothetical protein [Candidatus Marinarcus aquaticus]RXJ57547.1 hypothetical protein CRV04_06975 [Candidatus Marinarcus aquaticus]
MYIQKILSASVGGYLLSSLVTVTLVHLLPFTNKAESVVFASMLSFVLWLLFVLYTFSRVNANSLLIRMIVACALLFSLNTYLESV